MEGVNVLSELTEPGAGFVRERVGGRGRRRGKRARRAAAQRRDERRWAAAGRAARQLPRL